MIVGFTGIMGSGKTLSLTRRVYQEYNKGKKIYSNMHFNFPYERITKEKLLAYKQDHTLFNNCVIVIDEIHVFIDSRRSMSKGNVDIGHLLVMTRKLSVALFWTSQQSHQVDKRLRSNTDIMIYCESDHFKDLVIITNVLQRIDGVTEKETFLGNKYFDLYDTNEIIAI